MWISVKPVSSRCCERVLDELVRRVRVRPLLLLRDGECAELAFHAADVRLVQVEVLNEEDAVVAAALPAGEVGELTESEQVVRLEERQPVLEVEPLAGLDLLANRVERRYALAASPSYESLSTTRWVRASSSSRCTCPSRHARARSRVLERDARGSARAHR